jgi:hypothetical protein
MLLINDVSGHPRRRATDADDFPDPEDDSFITNTDSQTKLLPPQQLNSLSTTDSGILRD